MKTPEQLAYAVLEDNSAILPDTPEALAPFLIAAIEADRAQREDVTLTFYPPTDPATLQVGD